jgi:hypothetical protein
LSGDLLDNPKQNAIQHISQIEESVIDNKPLLYNKERDSNFGDIEELKVSDFGGKKSKARQSLLLDGLPDPSSTSP